MAKSDDMPSDLDARLDWVIAAQEPAERSRRYAAWAKFYESDLLDNFGYQAPARAVAAIKRLVPAEAQIFDAACGTGIVGKILHDEGYRDIAGGDFSVEMLELAERKSVYRQLTQIDLAAPLPLESGSFDAAALVGVPDVVPGSCLKELVRILRPEGFLFYCSGRERFFDCGYDAVVEELAGQDKLKVIGNEERFRPYLRREAKDVFSLRIFQVARD